MPVQDAIEAVPYRQQYMKAYYWRNKGLRERQALRKSAILNWVYRSDINQIVGSRFVALSRRIDSIFSLTG